MERVISNHAPIDIGDAHESKVGRQLGLLNIALRIVFFIVGPFP